MDKNIKLINLIKCIVLTVLFIAALYFENAQQLRVIILIAVFICYLAVDFYRSFLKRDSKLYFLSFILNIILAYSLEYNSRLLINYFFHSFYIVILFEAALLMDMKKGIIIGLITLFVSMIKYAYLIYYKFNLSSISQMAFFLMFNILILVIATFAQYNKKEGERKEILYKELLAAYKQLKEYNDEVKRLSVIEERNRIARDIHDSLGHNMTALIMQLQMAKLFLKEDKTRAENLLVSSVKTAKDSLTEIREAVETLRGADSAVSSEEAIRSLIDDFSEKTGAAVNLEITGKCTEKKQIINADLYRIIQESMTNAIRHGKAKTIWININYSDEAISFLVKDDGTGVKAIKEGYGLKGIRERVEAYNGRLEYKNENGFIIEGNLYLEGKNDKGIIG